MARTMRAKVPSSVLVVVVTALALLAGCGEDDTTTTADATTTTADDTTTTTSGETTTTEGEAGLGQSCQTDRYSIGYPDDWFTAGDPEFRCWYFHPDEFTVERGTEPTVAVVFDLAPLDYERYRESLGGNEADVVDEEELTIDGRQALRADLRSTGEGLYPEGTLYTVVAVDLDGETLTGSAIEGQAGPLDYQTQRQRLIDMARSLSLTS